jgi:1-hydroxycarotenoid 3,4-desaturase
MRWVFDELFSSAATSFDAEVDLEPSAVLARHAWSDGTRLDLYADPRRSADAIGDTFGSRDSRAYLAFCDDTRRMYELSEEPFLRGQRPNLASFAQFGVAGLAALARLDAHRTMWAALERRFESAKLRQLFGRYATYCGSSPFEAPATLNLIAHVEAKGVYRARGGMGALVTALERVARRVGVEFVHTCTVERILVERGKATGVVAAGTRHAADAIVFNGDVSALGDGRLGSEAARGGKVTPLAARSFSAVTWAMATRAHGFPLVRHNVFFSDDYRDEFNALVARASVPSHPTVYVCAQDRDDDDAAREEERLFLIVNAPATGDEPARWDQAERERCTSATMDMLTRMGLTCEPRATVLTTPLEFERLFPGTGGALYGPRSVGQLSALSRQGAATTIPGLYVAGGSVHPGAGVPMAALSGRLAAAKILVDSGLTAKSSLAATSGTTSMA